MTAGFSHESTTIVYLSLSVLATNRLNHNLPRSEPVITSSSFVSSFSQSPSSSTSRMPWPKICMPRTRRSPQARCFSSHELATSRLELTKDSFWSSRGTSSGAAKQGCGRPLARCTAAGAVEPEGRSSTQLSIKAMMAASEPDPNSQERVARRSGAGPWPHALSRTARGCLRDGVGPRLPVHRSMHSCCRSNETGMAAPRERQEEKLRVAPRWRLG